MSTFEEKETYKYLNTMKHAGKKEKRQKNTSGKRENYLKANYLADISSKGWILGLSPR